LRSEKGGGSILIGRMRLQTRNRISAWGYLKSKPNHRLQMSISILRSATTKVKLS